jgi:hypothetical protein
VRQERFVRRERSWFAYRGLRIVVCVSYRGLVCRIAGLCVVSRVCIVSGLSCRGLCIVVCMSYRCRIDVVSMSYRGLCVASWYRSF